MLTVMIVDDAKMVLNIVKRILEKEPSLNLEVHYYISSKEAKEAFIALQPDLLITDIFMPDIDGFELIKYVKSQSDIPIIAITSEKFGTGSSGSILKMAKSRGANHTLSKANLVAELPTLINNIFA